MDTATTSIESLDHSSHSTHVAPLDLASDPAPAPTSLNPNPSSSAPVKKRRLDVNPDLILEGRSKRRRSPTPEVEQPDIKIPIASLSQEQVWEARVKARQEGDAVYKAVRAEKDKITDRPLWTEFQHLPSADLYPDYYAVIKHPLSLSIISSKLKHTPKTLEAASKSSLSSTSTPEKENYDGYQDPEEVKHAFDVVWNNTKRYNAKESPIFQDAKKLHKLTKNMFAIYAEEVKAESEMEQEPEPEPELNMKDIDDQQPSSLVDASKSRKRRKPNGDSNGHANGNGNAEDDDISHGHGDTASVSAAERKRIQKLVKGGMKRLGGVVSPDASGRSATLYFQELPDKKEYESYYVYIKNPICLSEINRKTNQLIYNTFVDWVSDVQLMCDNAKAYNLESSAVYADAETIQSELKSINAEYIASTKPMIPKIKLSFGGLGSNRSTPIPVVQPQAGMDNGRPSDYLVECSGPGMNGSGVGSNVTEKDQVGLHSSLRQPNQSTLSGQGIPVSTLESSKQMQQSPVSTTPTALIPSPSNLTSIPVVPTSTSIPQSNPLPISSLPPHTISEDLVRALPRFDNDVKAAWVATLRPEQVVELERLMKLTGQVQDKVVVQPETQVRVVEEMRKASEQVEIPNSHNLSGTVVGHALSRSEPLPSAVLSQPINNSPQQQQQIPPPPLQQQQQPQPQPHPQRHQPLPSSLSSRPILPIPVSRIDMSTIPRRPLPALPLIRNLILGYDVGGKPDPDTGLVRNRTLKLQNARGVVNHSVTIRSSITQIELTAYLEEGYHDLMPVQRRDHRSNEMVNPLIAASLPYAPIPELTLFANEKEILGALVYPNDDFSKRPVGNRWKIPFLESDGLTIYVKVNRPAEAWKSLPGNRDQAVQETCALFVTKQM